MPNEKNFESIISEEDYTSTMRNTADHPENDSPGDSEATTKAEYEMGINFQPEEKELNEGYSFPEDSRLTVKIPENAKVVSSELPSPAMDHDAPTDTH